VFAVVCQTHHGQRVSVERPTFAVHRAWEFYDGVRMVGNPYVTGLWKGCSSLGIQYASARELTADSRLYRRN
jgi:hypothetical protein